MNAKEIIKQIQRSFAFLILFIGQFSSIEFRKYLKGPEITIFMIIGIDKAYTTSGELFFHGARVSVV